MWGGSVAVKFMIICMQNYPCCGSYVKQNINIYVEDKPLINNSVVISVYYDLKTLSNSRGKL